MEDRPKGIFYWVIIEVVTAIILIIVSIVMYTGIAYTLYDTQLRVTLEQLLAPYAGLKLDQLVFLLLTPGMFYIYGTLMLLLGLLFLVTAILLFMMKDAGRILSILDGVLILFTIVGLVLGIIMIWYFRRNKTRAYFQ